MPGKFQHILISGTITAELLKHCDWMKVIMHALAASCEELRARTGNPPLYRVYKKKRNLGIS